MNLTAKQISDIIDGEIIGNSDAEVNSVSKIEDGKSGDLCFLSNPKYASYIYSSSASIIIVDKTFIAEKEISSTLIKVDDAYSSFSQLLDLYNKIKFDKIGVSEKSDISSNATIKEKVFIGSFTSISEGAIIEENVKIPCIKSTSAKHVKKIIFTADLLDKAVSDFIFIILSFY